MYILQLLIKPTHMLQVVKNIRTCDCQVLFVAQVCPIKHLMALNVYFDFEARLKTLHKQYALPNKLK